MCFVFKRKNIIICSQIKNPPFSPNNVKWGLISESHRHNITHLMAEYTRCKNISFIAIVYTLTKKSKYLDQHLKRKSILHPYLYPV